MVVWWLLLGRLLYDSDEPSDVLVVVDDVGVAFVDDVVVVLFRVGGGG